MPTFKFVGPQDTLRIKGVELKKGEPFTTDNPILAAALAEQPNVKIDEPRETFDKPSKRSNGRS